MTRRTYIEIQLPFPGFYHSNWSGMIDHAEEMEIEHFERERQEEDGVPPELRLTADEYGSILYRHSDYTSAYREIAKDYVAAFSYHFKELTDIDLGLTFADMTSPRYYNFETDRLFANIPVSVVRKLVTMAKRNPKEFAKHIERRHKSYDGFHSFYSWDVQTWLEKSWRDYDHNELQTVLETVGNMIIEDKSDLEDAIFYSLAENDYQYHSECVDWSKVDSDVAELREEKAEELREEEPDYEPVYRCTETPDLFAWSESRQ